MIFQRIVYCLRFSAIGDLIIAGQCVLSLKQKNYFPVLVTSSLLIEVVLSFQELRCIICYDHVTNNFSFYVDRQALNKEQYLKFIQSIPCERPNIIVDLQKTSRSKRGFYALKKELKLNIEKKYTVSKRTFYRLFLILFSYFCFYQNKRKKDLNFIIHIHDLQENVIKKIFQMDQKNYQKTQFLPYLLAQKQPVSFKLDTKAYICLCPGASGFIKMWPKEFFYDLIELILKKTDLNIILLGGSNESREEIYLNYPPNRHRVSSLIGQCSLSETLYYISKSCYVVSNDSFAIHAAYAYGISGSVLFGATSPLFGFLPPSHKIHLHYQNLNCSPCSRHGNNKCRFQNLLCLRSISANDVFLKIEKTLFGD